MRETDLPSPGRFNYSYHLRRTVVNAISSLQVSKRADGKHPAANELSAFLAAAKTAVDTMTLGANPANTVAPAITGTAKVGSTLTTTNGTWTDATSYTRQWFAGTKEVGTGALTYVPVAGDIGKPISVVVTAVGPSGSTTKKSNVTSNVIP